MNEQRAREGVDHLQSAALEVIAALRAFLDVAEDVVRDPSGVTTLVQAAAAAGRQPNTGEEAAGVTRIREFVKSIDLGLDRNTSVGGSTNGTARIELHDAVTIVPLAPEERRAAIEHVTSALGARWVVSPASFSRRATSTPAIDRAGGVDLAAITAAEAAVTDARSALQRAEAARVEATERLTSLRVPTADLPTGAIAEAEARLEVAQAAAAAARREVVEAERAADDKTVSAADDAAREKRAEKLRDERAELDQRRNDLVERLSSLGAPTDSRAVDEALAGLTRLQQVKPRPSDRAVRLADRWANVRATLSELPAPPAPPDWLVIPAMAALSEAKAALEEAESSKVVKPDPAKIAAIEAAHREVLEAEQRAMKKASRANRKKLEQVQEVERSALDALGASSYGDYLQRIAGGGLGADSRIEAARAALADAEAVWEELHGGSVSPEYTAAKAEEASVRAEALTLLGEPEIADDVLEERLRSHLESVVDTDWATKSLVEALAAQGIDAGDDPEGVAAAFLASVPGRIGERNEIEEGIAAIDEALAPVVVELASLQADTFFGTDAADDVAARPAEQSGAGISPPEPVEALRRALEEATSAEEEAVRALDELRRRVADLERSAADAEAEAEAAGKRVAESEPAVEAARLALVDAENALAAAQAASAAATAAAVPESEAIAAPGGGDVAAGAWLLARLAALAGGSSNTPVVVDGRLAGDVRGTSLLEQVSTQRQVVVLGDEESVLAWAADLGDRAVVRSI